MSIEIGSIKTFTLLTGMEIIGKVVGINDGVFDLEGAFAVNLQAGPPDGSGKPMAQVSLAQLSPFEEGGVDLELYKSTILISTNPPDMLITQFIQANSSIITPVEPKIQLAH